MGIAVNMEHVMKKISITFIIVLIFFAVIYNIQAGCEMTEKSSNVNHDTDENNTTDDDSDDDVPTDDDDDSNDDDDDNDDDDNNNDDDDDTSTEVGVWVDESTGLMWQRIPPPCCCDEWEGAEYCEDLQLGGYNNWRLPSISELRSLIRGCPDTETDGRCGITDSCNREDSCFNSYCWALDCPFSEGPADGCYRLSLLKGNCHTFWSSTVVGDNGFYVWTVMFDSAGIAYWEDYYVYNANVRCVHDAD